MYRHTFIVAVALLIFWGCAPSGVITLTDPASKEYLLLLAKFPEDRQGEGIEPYYTTKITKEPMTYALVLCSESLHFRSFPNPESQRRIRNAVNWLVANSDNDQDGIPGWGLYDAWDAFGDGSINPPNEPYTITTAIVLNALMDAMSIRELWTNDEFESLRSLTLRTARRWVSNIWTDDGRSGFFWYSPNEADAIFVINASAMMTGSIGRILTELGLFLQDDDKQLFEDRCEKSLRGIVEQVQLRNNMPFWSYIAEPPSTFKPENQNDLVHHVYILIGIDLAKRAIGSKVDIPWGGDKAVLSLDSFWQQGKLYNYPQDITYNDDTIFKRPGYLWGIGAMLVYYASSGERVRSASVLNILFYEYGQFPNLRLWPMSYSTDSTFYARVSAHVLWGLAVKDFNYAESK